MKGLMIRAGILRILCLGTLGCLILLMQNSLAAAGTPSGTGIWCSGENNYKLSSAHKKQLVNSLRRITGLPQLNFAEDGSLKFGDGAAANAGSSLAIEILLRSLGSGKAFIIEDHSGSPEINFGQLDEGTDYEDVLSQRQFEIWRVRLDFQDFSEMDAPTEVRASFDVGFTMLHELLHGLGYKDAENEVEIGECEDMINRARAELGLPLRDQYFGEPLQLAPHIVTVRLRFRSEKKAQKETGEKTIGKRLHYLFFLLPSGKESIQLQPQEGIPVFNYRPKR